MYWRRFFTIGGWFTGLITAGLVLAAGAAVYAGSQQSKASKSAASQMRNGVQTFDPIAPNAPETVDWRRSAVDALNFNINHAAQQQRPLGIGYAAGGVYAGAGGRFQETCGDQVMPDVDYTGLAAQARQATPIDYEALAAGQKGANRMA